MRKLIIFAILFSSFINARILFTCGIIKVPANLGNGCFGHSDYNSCKAIAKKYVNDKNCYWDIMAYAKPPVDKVIKHKHKHIVKHKRIVKMKSRVVKHTKKRHMKLKVKRKKHTRVIKHKHKHIVKHKRVVKMTSRVSYKKRVKVKKSKNKQKQIKSIKAKPVIKSAHIDSDIDSTLIKATVKKTIKHKEDTKNTKITVDTKSLNKFF